MKREEGFTLIELIVAVAVLGVIIGAIAASLVVSLQTTDVTTDRLNESNDAQMAAVYYVQDVASATDVDVTDEHACAAGNEVVVQFSWTEQSLNGAGDIVDVAKVASYEYQAPLGADGGRLVRLHCTDAGAPSSVVIAQSLASKPILTCDGAGPGVCDLSDPDDVPRMVQLTVSETNDYTYELSGSRRAS